MFTAHIDDLPYLVLPARLRSYLDQALAHYWPRLRNRANTHWMAIMPS